MDEETLKQMDETAIYSLQNHGDYNEKQIKEWIAIRIQ